ncbi:mycofactocin-coupled SDR family oxidoreductase [Actinomadura vinacea]|uniref:Mycofactocin-coupled SDR family oxidoreductase n=1 Tax=Actinomadura vinacea TaxID=115336 RepID=A0ABP5WAW6_9ACTN
MGRVDGKVAFITGVARGQGRSHALRLAAEGADIIGVDICGPVGSVPYALASKEDLDETARAVRRTGRRMFTAVADVRDYPALEGALRDGIAEMGGLDIVSANAGIASFAPMHLMAEETWRDMIDVNLTGVWHTVKAAAAPLIEAGKGGSIILTASSAGLKGAPNIGHYAAAKHGVLGLMKSLANELAAHMIRVNSVLPTGVGDTGMVNNEPMRKLFLPDADDPSHEDLGAAMGTLNALPIPWVECVDVSNAVLFLASEEARFITGTALSVDAGWHVK